MQQLLIPYKAVYFLLEGFYTRKSLDGYLRDYIISDETFQSSLIVANHLEDYKYLSVMVNNRIKLSDEFIIFVKDSGATRITIEQYRDLSLLQFAILYLKTDIDITHFKHVIESVCHNENIQNTEDYIQYFPDKVKFIQANN